MAEGRKKIAQTIKWSQATSTLAWKTAASSKGPGESEKDHKYAVESAKQTDVYTEYALSDAARSRAAVDALFVQNPKSQHLEPTLPRSVHAAHQSITFRVRSLSATK